MHQFFKTASVLDSDTRAVTALEYALVAATICAVAMAGFTSMGAKLGLILTVMANYPI